MVASPDILSIFSSNLLNHQGLLIFVASIEHAPDLSALRIPPCEYLAVRGQRQRVMRTRGDLPQASFLVRLVEQGVADASRYPYALVELARHRVLKAPLIF